MAEYYDIFVGEEPNEGAAWAYVKPYPEAEVIAGRVAFWHGIEVMGAPDGEGQIEKLPSQHFDKSDWQGLCWYLKFTDKAHLDTVDIEMNTGIGEAELTEIWQNYNVQRYAQHYGWKMSLHIERT